jgi:hypothetical protein
MTNENPNVIEMPAESAELPLPDDSIADETWILGIDAEATTLKQLMAKLVKAYEEVTVAYRVLLHVENRVQDLESKWRSK